VVEVQEDFEARFTLDCDIHRIRRFPVNYALYLVPHVPSEVFKAIGRHNRRKTKGIKASLVLSLEATYIGRRMR
jgi:hypothetical protein